MKQQAKFYHAGCPVCLDAEQQIIQALDPQRYEVEVIHFSDQPERISEAEKMGIKSVPALLLNETVFHINFGASLSDVKA